ncbi:hypothetical protein SY2F82_59810 [Streptomyces sp. Y2F8-2]|nr:hypothetical protein SY2F82_59810 [Streptomyces sp. Y2F8-2]
MSTPAAGMRTRTGADAGSGAGEDVGEDADACDGGGAEAVMFAAGPCAAGAGVSACTAMTVIQPPTASAAAAMAAIQRRRLREGGDGGGASWAGGAFIGVPRGFLGCAGGSRLGWTPKAGRR